MNVLLQNSQDKKNQIFIYTRDITLKRVASGEIHLRDLAPGQHSSEETSQRWRAEGGTVSDLTGLGIEPQIYSADSDVFNQYANRSLI